MAMKAVVFKFMFKRSYDGKEVEGFHHYFTCTDLELSEELLLKIAKATGYNATRIVPVTEEDLKYYRRFLV